MQYTSALRFELHPENLGKEFVCAARQAGDRPQRGAGERRAIPTCGAMCNCGLLYFPETQHFVGEKFQAYWQSNGGIPVFGYPLSEAFEEQSPTDGKTYLVQYFERNRLEYHPENSGTPFETLLGLLGTQKYVSVYGANP